MGILTCNFGENMHFSAFRMRPNFDLGEIILKIYPCLDFISQVTVPLKYDYQFHINSS